MAKPGFEYKFFSCCDEPLTYLFSCFLPCCAYGELKSNIGDDYFSNCCFLYCCGCFGSCMYCSTRKQLKTKYGLTSGDFGSCEHFLGDFFCGSCSLTQLLRESRFQKQKAKIPKEPVPGSVNEQPKMIQAPQPCSYYNNNSQQPLAYPQSQFPQSQPQFPQSQSQLQSQYYMSSNGVPITYSQTQQTQEFQPPVYTQAAPPTYGGQYESGKIEK
eukprot:Pgem_evm1s11444